MKLIHYADHKITLNDTHQYRAFTGHKPGGLWVSDHDKWANWCIDNRFRIEWLEYAHEIQILPTANILYLTTPEEVRDFATLYDTGHFDHIDWDLLKTIYDGIIISPYHQDIRFEYLWYNIWDCASGCIWNPSVLNIKDVWLTSYHLTPQSTQ